MEPTITSSLPTKHLGPAEAWLPNALHVRILEDNIAYRDPGVGACKTVGINSGGVLFSNTSRPLPKNMWGISNPATKY